MTSALEAILEVEPWALGVFTSCAGSLLGTLGVQLRILADLIAVKGLCDGSCRCAGGCGGCCSGYAATTRGMSCKHKARCLQVIGWMSWISGQALGQVAIWLAPATVVACVTFSSALLCNTMLAPLVLQEQLTRAHGLGVILLSAGGSVVTTIQARSAKFRYTTGELQALALRVPFLIVACIVASAAFALGARAMRQKRLDAWSFAYLFAVVGAIDLLVTKCTLLMLTEWAMEPEVDAGDVWALVVSFAALTVSLHLFVLGFQVASTRYGEALQNTPLFLGSGAMMQVALCGTFFGEFDSLGCMRALGFCCGFAAMLVGLGVTSRAAILSRPEPGPEGLKAALLAAEEGAAIPPPPAAAVAAPAGGHPRS